MQTELRGASIFVQTVATAAWIVFFAIVGWMLFSVGADPVLAADGKAVYAKSCATCHGKTGKGDGAAAAALKPAPKDLSDKAYNSKLTDEYLADIIAKGGTAAGKSAMMPGFKSQLKDQEIKDLVSHIRSFAK